MMTVKYLQSCSSNSWRRYCWNSAVFLNSTASCTLFDRIVPFGNPRASVVPILDQWIEEGRRVEQDELQHLIKTLRKFKRLDHALEVSEWMSNKRYLTLSPADIAIRLQLISKVRGLEQAEKYFYNIPVPLRGLKVYSSLLYCYAQAESLEKAESIMHMMKLLGFANTFSYNTMLKFYARMGLHEKLDSLMQEMEKRGINPDAFTFHTRLGAYVTTSDIEGMEKLLGRVEADSAINVDWNTYVVAATGYLRAGDVEKASVMLKKSEKLIWGKIKRHAYGVLLTLYASTGDKNEVYRMWNLLKNSGKVPNLGYVCMISSLAKLDDIEALEAIWEEWEAQSTYLDFRIANLVVQAFCKKGLLGKAESIVDRLIKSGMNPSSSTWMHLAAQYHKEDQMEKAVEAMKKSIVDRSLGLRRSLDLALLNACLEYLRGKQRIEAAEELLGLLQVNGVLPEDVYERSLDYVRGGNLSPEAVDLLRADDRALGEEREMELRSETESGFLSRIKSIGKVFGL